ncbi:uncharacterized protein TNCV_2603231 [Trichonephila clavipes]|nr:uncharacterized protein TNCV_2603231 [Trichonephila clavipes]
MWDGELRIPRACFAWLPPSPYLIPCEIYLWEFIEDCVYFPSLPAYLQGIRHMNGAVVARITLDTLNKVWDELTYRLDVCRVTNGSHIEHL